MKSIIHLSTTDKKWRLRSEVLSQRVLYEPWCSGAVRVTGGMYPSRLCLLTFGFGIIESFSIRWKLCGKEHTMYSLMSLVDPMLTDRRCGCRGGELATNMQQRKIPRC
jgi:hypothetical protein